MKIINYLPIKNITQAIIAGIVVLVAGYLLYNYFDPLCAPCPIGVKCAPCTSKGQRTVLMVGIFLELVILAKGMLVSSPAADNNATPSEKSSI